MPRSVGSHDSYKTENADDGKAKSRHIRAINCEAGASERPANLFILALPCRCHHASLGFTYVSFSRRSLQTNPFLHFPYISKTCAHCILDKTYAHVMHTGVHRPRPLALHAAYNTCTLYSSGSPPAMIIICLVMSCEH